MQIHLDMYQTLAIAVVVLMLGQFLKQKIHFLEILRTCTSRGRSAFCDFYLCLLFYRRSGIFL